MTDRTLTNGTMLRLLASSALAATSMTACSEAGTQHRPSLVSNQGTASAPQAERALAAHDFTRALADAEQLVEAQPREAAYRTLLGRAYLANGRYQSARTAFEDAMTLGATDSRTIISLALVHTALGNAGDARALLAGHIGDLPAADYGLGMAVAGDSSEGVRALLEAVRQPDADAKTRQNLAYALALSGNWMQARLVAGQDLDGSKLQERLTQWAATAQSTAMPQRVAALIGVTPRGDDSGLPQRLALRQNDGTALAAAATPQPVDMASAAAAAFADAPKQHPAMAMAAVPAAAPAVVPAAAPAAEPAASPAPQPQAPAIRFVKSAETSFTVQPIPQTIAAPATPMRQPLARQAANAAPDAAHGTSDWVVQIGAYDSAAVAANGWKRASAHLAMLRRYQKLSGTITLDGQVWHRLAVSGFSDRGEAVQLCAALNRQGQPCFVRQDETVASEIRSASNAASGKAATLASR